MLGRRIRTLVLLIAACLLAAACTGTSTGDESDSAGITRAAIDSSSAKLDAIVESVIEETGVPGVALAVVYDDEVVYQQGYGVRSTETGHPVDPWTVFQVASMTKPIASTLLAGAVGNGVFDWDDPIHDYAPQLALNDSSVSEQVTFEDLFAHRSGLPGVAGNDLESVGFNQAAILDRLRYVPLEPFRSTYSYSNFGMTLAGAVAGRAAGTSWEELAEDVLFGPAGMNDSSMRHADFLARPNRAELHVEIDGTWIPAFDRQPDAQAPAGGVSSNVIDLAQWVRLQLNQGRLDDRQVIDAGALARTHTPMIVTGPPPPTGGHARFYGLGWNINTDEAGAVRWSHSGAFSQGAATSVTLLPSVGLGIVVLTNGQPIGIPEAITDAYIQLLRTGEAGTDWLALWRERMSGLYGEPLDLMPPANPISARADEAYVGEYSNDFVGVVRVVVGGDGGLAMIVGPNAQTFAIEHVDGDVFRYVHDPELPDHPASVAFAFDDGDAATSVTLSAFDGAGMGTLRRD